MYNYNATVLRVLDGDTIDVMVDLGFFISMRQRVRLAGINAPEVHSTNKAEKEAGMRAFLRLSQICPVGGAVVITTAKAGKEDEKYGRWLANVVSGLLVVPNALGERDAAKIMLAENLVKAWNGQGEKPI